MVKLFMVKPFLYPMKWPKDSEANWAIRQFIAGIPRSEMPPWSLKNLKLCPVATVLNLRDALWCCQIHWLIYWWCCQIHLISFEWRGGEVEANPSNFIHIEYKFVKVEHFVFVFWRSCQLWWKRSTIRQKSIFLTPLQIFIKCSHGLPKKSFTFFKDNHNLNHTSITLGFKNMFIFR